MKAVNLYRLTAPVRKGKATRKQLVDMRNQLIRVQLAGTNCQGYLKQVAERIRMLDNAAKESNPTCVWEKMTPAQRIEVRARQANLSRA